MKVGEIEEKNAHARRVSFATRHLATRLKTVKSARLEECDPKSVFPKSQQFSFSLVHENSERRTRVVDHTDERARVVVRRVRRRVGVTGSTRRRVPSRPARGLGRVEPGVELASGAGHRVSPTRFGSAGVEERNGRQHPPGRGGRPRLRRVEPSNRRASVHAVFATAVHGRGRGLGGVRVRDASAQHARARVVRREARARASRREAPSGERLRVDETRGAPTRPGASRRTYG